MTEGKILLVIYMGTYYRKQRGRGGAEIYLDKNIFWNISVSGTSMDTGCTITIVGT